MGVALATGLGCFLLLVGWVCCLFGGVVAQAVAFDWGIASPECRKTRKLCAVLLLLSLVFTAFGAVVLCLRFSL